MDSYLPLTEISIKRSLLQSLSINSLSLNQVSSPIGIIYQTSIALQLANGNLEKAQQINQTIINKISLVNNQTGLKFIVNQNHFGLLEFLIEQKEINIWLQKLPKLLIKNYSLSLSNHYSTDLKDEFFTLQYAHARCCSLLRLGHLDKLIQLKTLDFNQLAWFWLLPDPIPFAQILWQPKEEKELIEQIIKTIDDIDSVKSMKIAEDLSKAFLKFEQYCRIWGDVKRQNPTLAQARLGLIAIVQFLLRYLLKEKLGLIPLTEL